jgi:D-alanyl-D-alanine carboxypeptidase/D-alanyl-D-alanine-endopeptidase (penicillin-binding protein 4)
MKQVILLIWGFLFLAPIYAQTGLEFKGKAIQNAGYSVCVLGADDGETIYITPQISLSTASVMKLVTTAAALEILGSDFKFRTQLGIAGKVNKETGILEGDLIVKGGCDPAFYSGYFPEHYQGTFEAWAAALSAGGIKNIQGNLVIDLTRMDESSIPGGWLWEDIGNYYGAGVSALSYSDNYYKIHFAAPDASGQPVAITKTDPVIDSLILINKVISSDILRDLSVVYGAPGSLSQVAEGSIPKGKSDFIVKAAMPDPARTAALQFVKVLRSGNVILSGKIIFRTKPADEEYTIIAEKLSPALKELLVPLNQESINLFTEHLLRETGLARKGSPALNSSLEALTEFWSEKKIFLQGFYPTDGSGLSRSNALCSRTLAEVIRYMYLSPNRDDFFNSLPLAGRSGTLQASFKGSKLENNLRAKTGSMSRVRSLAGIFTNQYGRKIIFAIITNNFEGSQASVSHLIEDFLNQIYSLDTAVGKPV